MVQGDERVMYGNFTWSSHDMVQYNSGLNGYTSFYTKSYLSKTHSIANSVILAQHGVQVILSQLTLDDCFAMLSCGWEECIYKAKITAGGHLSAAFKILAIIQVFHSSKSSLQGQKILYNLFSAGKWPQKYSDSREY